MGIVLASGSERRRKLLGRIAPKFEVKAADVSERLFASESFSSAAMRLAKAKARKVAEKRKDATVIGADTIAYMGKRVYRKTENETAARKILLELSGRAHAVATGVAVLFPDGRCVGYSVKASVKMKELDAKTIDGYLKTGEWKGRAGCYDYSGRGRRLVAGVRGEKETVVGLPLRKLRKLLVG